MAKPLSLYSLFIAVVMRGKGVSYHADENMFLFQHFSFDNFSCYGTV